MMSNEPEEQSAEDLASQVDEALEALRRGESREMERLLESTDSSAPGLGEMLGSPGDEPAETGLRPGEPKQIGDYSIRSVLGRGGMGTVYLAVQEHPRRTVALKVMKSGIASRSALHRFEYESQILARLKHPNIAQVYDAGTHTTDEEDGIPGAGAGVPYFAMEYIPNARPITDYVRLKKLSTRQRLELFAKVCDAIHHGHQKGIIHRDLKPGNILVDSSGEPKIIDFGVARSTDSDMVVTTLQTDIGQLIGTLQYMSPEQCEADPHDLDVRSDVYALGVVLYELLCEQLPYDVTKVAVYEAMKLIREEKPARPSTLNRTLRGDIETIALKALEKERDRRYRSAADLGDDIRRYLSSEPIEARPPSVVYQVKMFARRNRAVFAVGMMVFAILAAATVVSLLFALAANQARQTAEREAQQRLIAEQDALAARDEEAQQRRAAEVAREEAQGNLALARQHEQEANEARDQLEVVVEFQQSMLSEVDPQRMGAAIVDDLRERARAALEETGVAPEEIVSSIASFDRLVNSVSATNLALKVIDEEMLSRAVSTIEKQFADQPVVEAALRQTIGDTYHDLGLYDVSMAQMQRALEIRHRELGPDHPSTLLSIGNMGGLLWAVGRYDEALRHHRESLEGFRRVLGDDHPKTLNVLSSMAGLLRHMGAYEEAETCYREALEGHRRVLGNDDPQTLNSINSMGLLLHDVGRLEEALKYHREALEGFRRVLGDDHWNTLTSINDLGSMLHEIGQRKEALDCFREAVEGRRLTLGDQHPSTLISINNMGLVLTSLGQFEEALSCFRESLGGFRRVLGDEHPSTLVSLATMDYVFQSMRKYEEAEPYSREALEGFRRVWGDDHPDTLTMMNNRGSLLESLGRYQEAEACLRQALETERRVLGNDHPLTLASLGNLGGMLMQSARYEEAEPYFRESLESNRRVLGDDHPQTLGAIINLGTLLGWLARYEEAEPLYREGLESNRRILGDDHPDTLVSIGNMGSLLGRMGRYEEAELYYREALQRMRRVLGDDHPSTLGALKSLSEMLRTAARHEEAEEPTLELYRCCFNRFGPEHTRTIDAITLLADLYTAWHEAEPDKGYDAKAAEWRAKLEQANQTQDQDNNTAGSGDS